MVTALVFNIFPTLLEVSLVTGILVSYHGRVRQSVMYLIVQSSPILPPLKISCGYLMSCPGITKNTHPPKCSHTCVFCVQVNGASVIF